MEARMTFHESSTRFCWSEEHWGDIPKLRILRFMAICKPQPLGLCWYVSTHRAVIYKAVNLSLDDLKSQGTRVKVMQQQFSNKEAKEDQCELKMAPHTAFQLIKSNNLKGYNGIVCTSEEKHNWVTGGRGRENPTRGDSCSVENQNLLSPNSIVATPHCFHNQLYQVPVDHSLSYWAHQCGHILTIARLPYWEIHQPATREKRIGGIFPHRGNLSWNSLYVCTLKSSLQC